MGSLSFRSISIHSPTRRLPHWELNFQVMKEVSLLYCLLDNRFVAPSESQHAVQDTAYACMCEFYHFMTSCWKRLQMLAGSLCNTSVTNLAPPILPSKTSETRRTWLMPKFWTSNGVSSRKLSHVRVLPKWLKPTQSLWVLYSSCVLCQPLISKCRTTCFMQTLQWYNTLSMKHSISCIPLSFLYCSSHQSIFSI